MRGTKARKHERHSVPSEVLSEGVGGMEGRWEVGGGRVERIGDEADCAATFQVRAPNNAAFTNHPHFRGLMQSMQQLMVGGAMASPN